MKLNKLIISTLKGCGVHTKMISYLEANAVSLNYGTYEVKKNYFSKINRANHFVNGTSLYESLFYLQKETQFISEAQSTGKFNTTTNPWALAGERIGSVH